MEDTVIKFPGWRFGPNGEAQIFERAEDVPEGWTDNPNDFKKAESDNPTGSEEDLSAMKYPDLRKIAEGLGLTVKIGTKKDALVAQIKAKQTEG